LLLAMMLMAMSKARFICPFIDCATEQEEKDVFDALLVEPVIADQPAR